MSRCIDADALWMEIIRRMDYCDDILEIIERQPTVQPERKKGKWEIYVISMLDGEGCRCSECGYEGAPYWDFCPNCGADMRGEQE